MNFKEYLQLIETDEKYFLDFDLICEVFKKDLSAQDADLDLVSDIFFEVYCAFIDKSRNEELIELFSLFRTHNFSYYKKQRTIYNDHLIEYHCAKNDSESLAIPVQDFKDDPLADVDMTFRAVKLLLRYGYTEWIDEIATKSFKLVRDSDKVWSDGYFFALIKFMNLLEEAYTNFKNNQPIEWEGYTDQLKAYDLTLEQEIIEGYEKAFASSLESLSQNFKTEYTNKENGLKFLSKCFYVYLKEKGVPFIISQSFFWGLNSYWSEENKKYKYEKYFSLEQASFKKYILSKTGMIIDYRFQSVSILYGAAYIYDFLLESNLITQESYDKTKEIIQSLKTAFIQENLPYLWKYNFVHQWPQPNMLSDEEWAAEKASFKRCESESFKSLREEIEPGFFRLTKEEQAKHKPIFMNFDNDRRPIIKPAKSNNKDNRTVRFVEARVGPKIGRNEKVTVEYNDGTIKKDVKYKKVMKDVENGACKII